MFAYTVHTNNQSLMNRCMSLRTNLHPMMCPISRIFAGINPLPTLTKMVKSVEAAGIMKIKVASWVIGTACTYISM